MAGVSIDVETISPTSTGGFLRFFGRGRLVYSAKFLCGTITGARAFPDPANKYLLVPGVYLTAVNIHNPNAFRVDFTKQAVIVNPQRLEERGKIGAPVRESLEANAGVEVDCEDINTLLGVSTLLLNDFHTGFVVINSPRTLIVTVVYTLERLRIDTAQAS